MGLNFTILAVLTASFCYAQLPPGVLAQLPGRAIERTFPANTKGDLRTGVAVKQGDYVYIEATGDVEISQVFHTKTDATGSTDGWFNALYNRYKPYWHAALLCRIGNSSKTAFSRNLFDMVPKTERVFVESISIFGRGDEPGVLLLAPETGELILEINDTKTEDNRGNFKVSIYKLTQQQHRQRNQYNRCPVNVDQVVEVGDFESDDIGTFFYHTDPNQQLGKRIDIIGYRGVNRYAGCQCIYDKNGNLVNKGIYMGTFDYALARPELQSSRFMHYILDVIPHIMYRGALEISDNIMYTPTPASNIIRIP